MSNSMSNSTVTMSGNGGNGVPQIKTDMMYTHAAAAAAAGIPVSAGGGGGSPTSGLSNSRLHQVRQGPTVTRDWSFTADLVISKACA